MFVDTPMSTACAAIFLIARRRLSRRPLNLMRTQAPPAARHPAQRRRRRRCAKMLAEPAHTAAPMSPSHHARMQQAQPPRRRKCATARCCANHQRRHSMPPRRRQPPVQSRTAFARRNGAQTRHAKMMPVRLAAPLMSALFAVPASAATILPPAPPAEGEREIDFLRFDISTLIFLHFFILHFCPFPSFFLLFHDI